MLLGGVAGLYLKITGNSRRWALRAVVAGKRRNIGLGSYPTITLAQAREKAKEAHELISRGIDPIEEKKKVLREVELERTKGVTFDVAAQKFIESKEAEWKNDKHRAQWSSTLKTYASPVIGKMPVKDIDKTHILAILDPIWRVKTETAKRVRGRIEQVIDWSIYHGYRDQENPARWKGHLEIALPKPSKIAKVEHHPAVQWEQAPLFIKELLKKRGVSAKALLFHILTVARASEVRFTTWDEIDFKKKQKFISAEKMKMDKDHLIPLSRQAIELLENIKKKEGTDYIFTTAKLKPLSDMAMTELMRGMGFRDRDGRMAVPHGFRSTFTDWASETTDYPSEVIKMAKAHAIADKTEQAYRRGALLKKREALMQDWADYCFSLCVYLT